MAMKDERSMEIPVHPAGWESGPEIERYPLSLMGHFMPKIYVLIAEVFALPDKADTEAITKNMTAGLEFTLSQFPVLAGVLDVDEASGRMWVTKKRNSTVSLHVKHMPDEGEFPSYEELERKDVRTDSAIPFHTAQRIVVLII
jgi:hypothetical protein